MTDGQSCDHDTALDPRSHGRAQLEPGTMATMEESVIAAVPGDVVLTSYGVATVLEVLPNEGRRGNLLCSLWRQPGRSIASSAKATLRTDAILRHLPAGPGMKTRRLSDGPDGDLLLVLTYSEESDVFIVAPANNDRRKPEVLMSVPSSDLEPSKSARVYPLLHRLMQRGDDASNSTRDFLASEQVKTLKTEVRNKVDQVVDSVPATSSYAETINELPGTSSIKEKIPNSEEVHAIYSMLKDEELTVLLQKGRSRLRQLVSDDIPKATETALRGSGIEIDLSISSTVVGETSSFSYQSVLEHSREKALVAIDAVLSQRRGTDLDTLKESMSVQFGTMFDTLAEASGSDRTLSSIFENINEKTSGWQALSGRLLSTRSVNVFMEGTARLRKRAKDMFSIGSTGASLTKAFTERDVAVARLKSIEMGDALRSRLVAAIDLRSESEGGLDGIIAGALKRVTVDSNYGPEAKADLVGIISSLQQTATSKKRDTQETLISLVSQKSTYRDLALSQIEDALIDLEAHFEMSAEDLASLASSDGGTSVLFRPIALKAAKEIEKQLHSVEESVADETVNAILIHVRRIVSGELTVSALVDEVSNLLNDEHIVTAGEDLVKKGELVLDAFEGKSGNKAIDDVMAAAEKAGITKETVMARVQQLDMNTVLDTATSAATDEETRHELISSATDSALDFLLNILPSMPVPPFDGARDGVIYHLSNLSLEGFKVKKEDISVEIAGIKTSKAEASTPPKAVKATELLIIDVCNISAELDNAVWSFEQTFFPYLKGGGKADSRMWDGHIKIQFELKKERVGNDWEPRLCLSKRFVTIGEVELVLQGDGKLTWLLNKLADLFKVSLRDYCVTVIATAISNRSGWLLETLNSVLAQHWGVILRTAKLVIDDLAEITDADVTSAAPNPEADHYDLIFYDQLPLGVNLLLNDKSGFIRVVDMPRGSQARKVCEDINLDPDMFKGATMLAVNGTVFSFGEQNECMASLKDPGRPKTIRLKVAHSDNEAERIENYVQEAMPELKIRRQSQAFDALELAKACPIVEEVEIVDDGQLGLRFSKSLDDIGLVVRELLPEALVERSSSSRIDIEDILSHVNDNSVLGGNGAGRQRALELLEAAGAKRTLTLSFIHPYLHLLSFQDLITDVNAMSRPDEFLFEEKKLESGEKKIVIKGLQRTAGIAEVNGIILGDQLVSVNGFPVGEGCKKQGDPSPDINGVMAMIRNEDNLVLTFARTKRGQDNRWNVMGPSSFDIDNAETFIINSSSGYEQLGCEFGVGTESGSIVVKQFHGIKGAAWKAMEDKIGKCIIGLSVEAIAGQMVPSYASSEMVQHALERNWPTDVLFCNDDQRMWVRTTQEANLNAGHE